MDWWWDKRFNREAWAEHENLYNKKHKSYFNRDIRQKLLTLMENMLKDNGITATVKQIGEKRITGVKTEWLRAWNPVELELMKSM